MAAVEESDQTIAWGHAVQQDRGAAPREAEPAGDGRPHAGCRAARGAELSPEHVEHVEATAQRRFLRHFSRRGLLDELLERLATTLRAVPSSRPRAFTANATTVSSRIYEVLRGASPPSLDRPPRRQVSPRRVSVSNEGRELPSCLDLVAQKTNHFMDRCSGITRPTALKPCRRGSFGGST